MLEQRWLIWLVVWNSILTLLELLDHTLHLLHLNDELRYDLLALIGETCNISNFSVYNAAMGLSVGMVI